MKKSKKMIIATLSVMMAFSSGVFASQTGLYQTVVDRLISLKSTYVSKDSQLVEDGFNAQKEISSYVEGLETEFQQELDQYEAQQVEEARKQINKSVIEVKNSVEGEKEKILKEIKDQIKSKIEKDLEKELKDLEKALKKNY